MSEIDEVICRAKCVVISAHSQKSMNGWFVPDYEVQNLAKALDALSALTPAQPVADGGLVADIQRIASESVLPNGDVVPVSVALWAEGHAKRLSAIPLAVPPGDDDELLGDRQALSILEVVGENRRAGESVL